MNHLLRGNDFVIEKKENTFLFSGHILVSNDTVINHFLDSTFREVTEDRIILNFVELAHLSSPGLSALTHAIKKLPENMKVQFKTDKEITWQDLSIKGIRAVCPGRIEGVD